MGIDALHGGGSPVIEKVAIYRDANIEHSKSIAKKLAGIPYQGSTKTMPRKSILQNREGNAQGGLYINFADGVQTRKKGALAKGGEKGTVAIFGRIQDSERKHVRRKK